MLKRFYWVLPFMLLAVLLVQPGCGKESDDDDESCPSFAEYPQAYPDYGTADSEYELYVRFKDKKVNRELERVYAQLNETTGQHAGVTFDLVRTENDPHRYLRSFKGSEVCESGTCFLRFNVFAEHIDGCVRSLESNIFVVVIDEGDDDTQ